MFGRVWGGMDGYKVFKDMVYIYGAGTGKAARLSPRYWEFWEQQAKSAVDSIIREEEKDNAQKVLNQVGVN
jgi:hypothetical protein